MKRLFNGNFLAVIASAVLFVLACSGARAQSASCVGPCEWTFSFSSSAQLVIGSCTVTVEYTFAQGSCGNQLIIDRIYFCSDPTADLSGAQRAVIEALLGSVSSTPVPVPTSGNCVTVAVYAISCGQRIVNPVSPYTYSPCNSSSACCGVYTICNDGGTLTVTPPTTWFNFVSCSSPCVTMCPGD